MSVLPLPPAPLDSPISLTDSTDSTDSFSSFDYECVVLNHNEMTVLRSPKDSKFPVYMITSPHDDKNYILKIFPYEENQISCYYQREARFDQLSHENIIEISHIENFAQFYYGFREFKVSYIMSEYAQNGDFYQAINTHKLAFDTDEKLLRTYFHQLIEGLEYLHIQGVAHLDIKPENLMLAGDYTLKIIDFDLSYCHGDDSVTTKGTKNYRAPELFTQTCEYPELADIYSVAITLFFLKTKGYLPYMEDQLIDGIDMVVLKQDNPARFWKVHEQRERRPANFFSPDFKELFMSMVNINPAERATIHEIKNSQWYNGEVYNKEELNRLMKAKLRN